MVGGEVGVCLGWYPFSLVSKGKPQGIATILGGPNFYMPLWDPSVDLIVYDVDFIKLCELRLIEPEVRFGKPEPHSRKKISKGRRVIWHASALSEVVTRWHHDFQNKVENMCCQGGLAHSEQIPMFGFGAGMGHHDGLEATKAAFERLRLQP